MRTLAWLLLAAAILAPVAAGAAEAAPGGDPARGRKLFLSVGCYACHGTSGLGGSDRTAPPVAPNPKPFAYFIGQLRGPIQRMPVYTAAVLPDADAADIYAFLRTVPPPKKVSEIPLLNR